MHWQKKNDLLQNQLEEAMANERISLFADGRYTDATRLVVYELLSKGVGSRQVGTIIQTVLSGLVNVAVDRVPQFTIVKQMSAEAALLAKASAAHDISTNEGVSTLHTDGTTKKHRKYLDFLATTSKGKVEYHVHGPWTSSLQQAKVKLNITYMVHGLPRYNKQR